VDASGGLFVSDMNNHRIVYFAPGVTASASRVFGQDDFTGSAANRGLGAPTAAALSSPQGLLLRAEGLYVGDRANARVLRFPVAGGEVSDTADGVWGQLDYVSNTAQAVSATTFQTPVTMAVDNHGNLYVVDAAANRVLRITL